MRKRKATTLKLGRARTWSWQEAATRIERGLATAWIDELQDYLGLTKAVMARQLGVSESTVDRRKQRDVLPPVESDRLYRLARLAGLAEQALGSPDEARRWLKEPNFVLGGQVPLTLAETEPGARLVERALAGLEHGLAV